MRNPLGRSTSALLAAAALAPLAHAQPATCSPAGAEAVSVGTVTVIPAGISRNYALDLGAGEGVIVDLVDLAQDTPSDASDEQDSTAPSQDLAICDGAGNVLAPMRGEVFEKGGSLARTTEGLRLRFAAATAGRYIVAAAPAQSARELLVRRRDIGAGAPPVASARLDGEARGTASSVAPAVYSFAGSAGQWIELKSTSEIDTVLRLAGPDRQGGYSVIAENDDSDGLNPMIRRRLPVTGTYFLQVDSLSEERGEFTLALRRIAAPPPPPAPAALRVGAPVSGRLAHENAVKLYTLPVAAGRNYRIEASAPYDVVVAIGLPNPVEPEDGGTGPDAGFAEIRAQDGGVTGTEQLNFTARSSGQLLVRVRSFGTGESDGGYSLRATDLGG